MATQPRGCLAAIFGGAGGSSSSGTKSDTKQVAATTFPYTRTDCFFSPAEASFFAALRVALAEEYEIFAKVRLLDVLNVKPGQGWQAAFNRVQSKHIDFLLCDRATSRPVLVIELDDSSHQRADRKTRDAFLDKALEVVGLPVLHVPVTRAYDPRELGRLIKSTLSGMPGPKSS